MHRNLVWIRYQLDVTFVLSFISPLKLLNMFRAIMCPSSEADDCVVLWPRVGVVPWLQEGCQNRLVGSVSIEEFVAQLVVLWSPLTCYSHYLLTGSDSLPAATAQFQHVVITLRSRQLLKMVIWLPETCWANCKGERITHKWLLVGFLSTLTKKTFFFQDVMQGKQVYSFQSFGRVYCRLFIVMCWGWR